MEINFIEILIANIIGMALGALWYSPLMFGDAWMRCLNKTPETLGKSTVPMIGSVIANLLTAIGVSLLFSMMNITDISTAAIVGVILGLLIIFPALLSDNLFCGWGNKLLMIQSGYRVLNVFIMCLAIFYL